MFLNLENLPRPTYNAVITGIEHCNGLIRRFEEFNVNKACPHSIALFCQDFNYALDLCELGYKRLGLPIDPTYSTIDSHNPSTLEEAYNALALFKNDLQILAGDLNHHMGRYMQLASSRKEPSSEPLEFPSLTSEYIRRANNSLNYALSWCVLD